MNPSPIVCSAARRLPDKVFGEFLERCDHESGVEIASVEVELGPTGIFVNARDRRVCRADQVISDFVSF